MTGVITTPLIGITFAQTFAGTGTNFDQGAPFTLGTSVMATANQQWVYVHANGAVTRYYWVGIDNSFEAAHLTAQNVLDGLTIGVAEATALADNDFGWVATKGASLTGRVAAAAAANTQLYTSANAGILDSNALTSVGTSVASFVYGAVISTAGTTSVAANAAVVLFTYPAPFGSTTASGY